MGSHHELDICSGCGLVRRMHGTGLAGCTSFTAAVDEIEAAAATESARAAGERREQAYNALRRAVANRRLEQAHAIITDLMKATS